MSFLEFVGPEKALAYGIVLGFVIGVGFTVWLSERKRIH